MKDERKYKVVHRYQRSPRGGWWVEPILRDLTLAEAQAECRALIQNQQGPGTYAVEAEYRL
jgi:hypothetical protein